MTTTTKLPVFFFGHGSPMNITEQNDFTRMLQHTGRSLPNPLAILVISAHWVTQGSYVSVITSYSIHYTKLYEFCMDLIHIVDTQFEVFSHTHCLLR